MRILIRIAIGISIFVATAVAQDAVPVPQEATLVPINATYGELLQANSALTTSLSAKETELQTIKAELDAANAENAKLVADYNQLAVQHNQLVNALVTYYSSTPAPVSPQFSWKNLIGSTVNGALAGYGQPNVQATPPPPRSVQCNTVQAGTSVQTNCW